MRVALHQVAVLEDPGLALLSVHHDELRGTAGGTASLPLHRRLEVGPAPPLQPGRAHLFDDSLGPAGFEGMGQRTVGASPDGVADVAGVDGAATIEQDAMLGGEPAGIDLEFARPRPRRHEIEEARDLRRADRTGAQRLAVIAKHADRRSGPAGPTAPARRHRQGHVASRDLHSQRIERLARSYGEAAASEFDEETRTRCPERGRFFEARKPGRRRRHRRGQPRRDDGCLDRVARTRGVAGRRGAEEPVEIAPLHAPDEAVLDLDDGRDSARERAVHLLERDLAICGGGTRGDATPALPLAQQLQATAHAAAHAGAHADEPPAGRRQAQLWIVRGHAPHLAEGHAQVSGDGGQAVGREAAFGAPCRVERGEQPRSLPGELRRRRCVSRRRQGHERYGTSSCRTENLGLSDVHLSYRSGRLGPRERVLVKGGLEARRAGRES